MTVIAFIVGFFKFFNEIVAVVNFLQERQQSERSAELDQLRVDLKVAKTDEDRKVALKKLIDIGF